MRLLILLRTTAILLTGLAFVALSGPLRAQTAYSFTATYTGGLTAVGFTPGPPAVTELAGTGSGPADFSLSAVSLDLFAQFNSNPQTAVGSFIHTAANGDQLFGYTPDEVVQLGAAGSSHFTFTGDEFITGGTGLFAGATGNIPFSGSGDFTGPTTNTFTYTNTGVVVLVPEPSRYVLLLSLPLAGAGFLADRRVRRSRSRRVG